MVWLGRLRDHPLRQIEYTRLVIEAYHAQGWIRRDNHTWHDVTGRRKDLLIGAIAILHNILLKHRAKVLGPHDLRSTIVAIPSERLGP